MAIYCTYKLNGQLRRGTLSQQQYSFYEKDISVTELKVYANQLMMESYFNDVKGIKNPIKQILHS